MSSSQPPNKKAELERLQKIWYKKLKTRGFNDIEQNEYLLKSYDACKFQHHPIEYWEAKRDYFVMAEHFLNEYKFKTRLDKIIWEYHTHDISARNIVRLLAKVKIKTSRTPVWQKITQLRQIMFKMYRSEGKDE